MGWLKKIYYKLIYGSNFEDFTDYDVVDPNKPITVGTTTIDSSEDFYIYRENDDGTVTEKKEYDDVTIYNLYKDNTRTFLLNTWSEKGDK